jgi:hypothetical protein
MDQLIIDFDLTYDYRPQNYLVHVLEELSGNLVFKPSFQFLKKHGLAPIFFASCSGEGIFYVLRLPKSTVQSYRGKEIPRVSLTVLLPRRKNGTRTRPMGLNSTLAFCSLLKTKCRQRLTHKTSFHYP